MRQSFFFYDLETSGFQPRTARIMQFAGQRTSLDLKPLGEPHNHLLSLTNDVLPDVGAIFVTGITPQFTVAEGMTEAQFLEIFHTEIATPGTIFVGYNSVRFDDEFLRFLNYRNFHDPYEWHWSQDRSRWDLLDVVRMTRALRPEGIEWPVNSEGNMTNRLEDVAKVNGVTHEKAHDALSDIEATISIAQLIHSKQPKLFDHLLNYRDKRSVSDLVMKGQPFAYTSGKYPSSHLHTTATVLLGEHPKKQGVFVYDLRIDPATVIDLPVSEIITRWKHYCDERPCPHPRFPVKTMQFNRCPAVAPLGVLDEASRTRIALSLEDIERHHAMLKKSGAALYEKVVQATKEMDATQADMFGGSTDADGALYDNFLPEGDKRTCAALRAADATELPEFVNKFDDPRLRELSVRYIARNYPKVMTDELRTKWESFRAKKLMDGGEKSLAARYFADLAKRAGDASLTNEQRYLLEELQLWGESILPAE